jgi:hypothetical protein
LYRIDENAGLLSNFEVYKILKENEVEKKKRQEQPQDTLLRDPSPADVMQEALLDTFEKTVR